MAIRQLSVFVENKKGTLHEITDVLAKSGIDLRSMSIADTSDYGIVRIIASEPERAKEILKLQAMPQTCAELMLLPFQILPADFPRH